MRRNDVLDQHIIIIINALLEQYKFIREEIRNEHQLINNRLNITLAVHGFLLAAYVEIIQTHPKHNISDLSNIVFVLLLTLLLPQLGIYAALKRIEMWRSQQNYLEFEMNKKNLYCIQKNQPIVHRFGELAYRHTIPIFFSAWLCLFFSKNNPIVIILITLISIMLFILINFAFFTEDKDGIIRNYISKLNNYISELIELYF